MTCWHLNPADAVGETARAFASLDAVFALEGEEVASDSLCRVLRVELDGRCYYVKRYIGNGKNAKVRWYGLRQWLGKPRVQSEWENLLSFARWGIPTARVVAYGLDREWGGFRRGALITEAIPNTRDLANLVTEGDARLQHPDWVKTIARQVADMARRMHAAGFAHNDFKWRNILVNQAEPPQAFLIDCPSGSFWWRPFLNYRMIKDLACLDKVARYHLSRTQRLRFYLAYQQQTRLQPADKKKIARIVSFFEGRE